MSETAEPKRRGRKRIARDHLLSHWNMAESRDFGYSIYLVNWAPADGSEPYMTIAIGGKHAMSVKLSKNKVCELTRKLQSMQTEL